MTIIVIAVLCALLAATVAAAAAGRHHPAQPPMWRPEPDHIRPKVQVYDWEQDGQ